MPGPFDDLIPSQPAAPQAPGVIMGRPKAPTELQVSAEQRAREDQAREGQKFDVSKEDTNFNQARNLRKDFDGLQEVGNYKKIISSYAASVNTDETPEGDQLLINSYAQMLNPTSTVMLGEYQATEQNQTAIDQIQARIQRELKFDSAGRLLPESRARVREEMQNIAERANEAYNLKRNEFRGLAERYNFDPAEIIGPHLGDPYRPQIEEYRRKVYGVDDARRPAMAGDVPVGANVQVGGGGGNDAPFDRDAFLASRGLDANKEATATAFWNENSGNEGLTPISALRFYAEQGIPPPSDEDLNKMVEQAKAGFRFGPIDTTDQEAQYRALLEKASQQQGEAGYTQRADQGITLGLSDEAAGVGGAISSLLRGADPTAGYQFSRDVERLRNEQADQNTGLAGDAVELGSSLFLPFGSTRTVRQAAKVGAVAGGVGGFGYGEGAQGSATGAGVGALAGGTIGAGAGWVGNALLNRQAARQISGNQANALLQAGADEGVTVNRAMANPALQPRVTGVSGTMAGSRSIERNMGEIGGQIEGRVADLGGGGTSLTNEVGGSKVRAVAERQIKKSGEAAKKIYDRAEQASSGVKITPKESLARVDDIAKTLSETPGSNKAELEYLKTLKSDLSKDLSVGGLRRLRTKLRKSISKGDLVFGENEADVLSIMDSASLDIANGLRSQGKVGAAKLFEEADNLYRERAKYIDGTLQKLIGKRNSTMSDQQVFAKFRSLADPKGDGPALERFMSEMSPDEVADVAATFADDLGRNSKNEFSTAFLVSQAEKLKENPTALKAIFGDAGAKSLDNLITLSREHARVTNAARGSQTGVRADYRSWLTNAIFTGGAGLTAGLTQGAGTAALAATATAATVGAAKLGKDALSARLLMSPKVTGWLRSAPKTTDPAAINKHWAKLGAIAKAEPALAAEIDAFRNGILGAANDNAQRAVAQDRQD